jgi:hypothetical protein
MVSNMQQYNVDEWAHGLPCKVVVFAPYMLGKS